MHQRAGSVKGTVLSIVPADGTRGPSLKLRFRIVKPIKKAAFGISGSAIVAILLGTATLWPSIPYGWKAFSVIGAAMLAGFLKLKSRLTPVGGVAGSSQRRKFTPFVYSVD